MRRALGDAERRRPAGAVAGGRAGASCVRHACMARIARAPAATGGQPIGRSALIGPPAGGRQRCVAPR
ncbi:hypothetical protein AQ730_26930 [Burkholderia pseudomallei]|nr:hypothetical protein AQ846_22185 [Burkholderia pseudomallei]OMR82296.1 hypothetical protein AQ730_26930 [Burkholderia pseudomallei]OMS42578.1 hypothetical protein AQ742_06690 [Burkholderia pseudomallei]OMU55176.1 hypothetical protein AQ776_22380 [Burkholderia pseudomallei]OMU80155.1 hypothetical protein AQ783_14415 [Burkholderia pseudomallei]